MTGYSTPRPISDIDDAATFDSGEPTLDDYLRNRALGNHVGGGSRCFVTCRDGRIVGYYALASGAVAHKECAGKYRRNMPDPIPVILLSRLAIDRKHQGCGLGENMLRDAIARSVQVAEQIGVRAILVHALHDEARRFYTRYQFEPSPTDPLHLMLLIKDAKASVPVLQGEADAEERRREISETLVAGGAKPRPPRIADRRAVQAADGVRGAHSRRAVATSSWVSSTSVWPRSIAIAWPLP